MSPVSARSNATRHSPGRLTMRRAEGISMRPREAVMTGTTCAFSLRAASSPPAKSTTNRQAKWLRLTPTWPPTPVEPIAVEIFDARLRLLLGSPEGNDIVIGLIGGRNLDEHHGTLVPRGLGLDPHTGPLVVEHPVVLVLCELTLALHQSEATRCIVEETVDAYARRVHQRAPDPFPGTVADLQSVGVMNLRPPVIVDAPVVLAAQEHAGGRRNADALDLTAGIESRIDIHQRGVADVDDEAV